MDLPEANTHSFIVRIWLEEVASATRGAKWRGHITHVPSGTRHYLKGLDDIIDFIVPYLETMGVWPRCWIRSWQWMRHHLLRKIR